MGRGGGYAGGPGKDEQHIPKENELVDSVASANHGTPSHSFSTPSHHPHYPSNGGQPDDGWGNSEHLAGFLFHFVLKIPFFFPPFFSVFFQNLLEFSS